MKKMNARRFVSLALALMMILPVVSIPALASGTSQTSNSSESTFVGSLEALFEQNFEAFDTLSGPVTPASGVFKGPTSAKIIPSADGHGNVLQIDCKAMTSDGRFWVCFNNNNNIWINVTNLVREVIYYHPDTAEGKGANIKGVDPLFTILDLRSPRIQTSYREVIVDGLMTTTGKATYRVRGVVNTDSRSIECKLYYYSEIEYQYEFVQDYEYEYQYLYRYQYEYEYEYEHELDENGEAVLDEMGNKIYILDEEGQKKPLLDENGNNVYALDENGNKIPKKDANGSYIIKKDADGNNLYELDEEGNKIPVLDHTGSMIPLYYPNATKVPVLDADGNKVRVVQTDANGDPVLDEEGNPVYKLAYDENGKAIPQYDELGIPVPALDENGNKVYITDDNGNMIPLTDAKGRQVYKEVPLDQINHNGTKAVPATDENGNAIWQDVFDADGNPVMIPQYNADGSIKMVAVMVTETTTVTQEKKDENGNVVTDENGNVVMETVEIQTSTPLVQFKKDENGNPVFEEKKGMVYEQATDADGNLLYDNDGKPIWVQDTNEDGSLKFNANGKPVYKSKYEIVTQNVTDENGNLVYENVLDANGNPIWEQQTDANGNLLFDANGNAVMGFRQQVKTEIVYTDTQATDDEGNLLFDENGDPVYVPKTKKVVIGTYKVMVMEAVTEPAPYVQKQEQVMVQVPITNITSKHLTTSRVYDSYGGFKNIGNPAYIQSAAITSDLLIFSTDYYFSADDPTTEENEALSHGIDIRINVTDENGKNKTFDFVSCNSPANGMIEIKAHTDAPTTIVSGGVKVPLGEWCNIMIVADMANGIYALYVNGEMIAVRQQATIQDTKIQQEVMIESQTDKPVYVTDENGNVVLTELLDENGNVVLTVQQDAEGNEVYTKKVDENGNYVYDDEGVIVMQPMLVPVMVPKVLTDENGNIVYEQTDKLDSAGNIVWQDKLDENGEPTWVEQTDADGNPILGPKIDENGNYVKDNDGNIIMEPIMVTVKEPVQVNAKTTLYKNALDEDGNIVTTIKTENGAPVLVDRIDNAGNTIQVPVMIPVQEAVTEVKLDENGNPVTEEVTVKAPASSRATQWNCSAVSTRAGTWNLGHFKRGGKVADYHGYMYIDNVAVYDGKDLTKVFASRGYEIDTTIDYEELAEGTQIKIDGKDTSSKIIDYEGDKVVKIDYADSTSIDANYKPTTPGFSYMTSDKVVLEANYFLETGASGQFQSQFRLAGCNWDVPEAPFEYSYISSTSRESPWIDLYTILANGSSATVSFQRGTDGRTATLDLGKWYAFSLVIDLQDGTYTLYINGVDSISGQLTKYIQVQKDPNLYEWRAMKNISVAPNNWIVSKINKGQTNPTGSFYVDDVTVTTLGGETAKMERVQGMLSADIYANGMYVTTVTDHNLFYTSDKIEIRNAEIYDLGSDEILHTDDATIRFTSPAGIRFTSILDIEALEALCEEIKRPANADEEANWDGDTDGIISLRAVSFGTLIVPTDLLDGKELTFEVLEDNKIPYLDVKGTIGSYYDPNGDGVATHISGSIVDLKEENIDRLFSGVGYIHLVLENGIEYNIYAHRTAKTSAWSLADDSYGTFNTAQQAVIDAFLAGHKPSTDYILPDQVSGKEN